MKLSPFASIAALLMSGTAVAAAEPKSPTPKGNPGGWANSNDYPSNALRQEIEGVTRFELTIDETGKTTGCEVTTSSGSDDLDNTTCALMMSRSAFDPATDANGKRIAGTWSSSVRWEIPSDSNAVPPVHSSRISYIVDADGSVRDCKADVSLVPGAGEQICASIIARSFDPPMNAKGEPEAVRVIMSSKVEHESVPR